ncbi:acetyltransferase [Bacillus manliponensis]|uniref:Acetyltransferase n=1 Tax=Bacillus manliponensis TaxID=574376 RepID=A0A073JWN7_9BACI|nr:GNAT family N-acetyltransferase [Bacillus manliponensis]KEK18627.1 acetyltransferase [Bacillus manliponensis]
MKITKFHPFDTKEIVTLFYETVHHVNEKDYTSEELHAWAPWEEQAEKIQSWQDSLSQNITYVAKINNNIVGFADLTHAGYLDRLYVHKDYQGHGIASALVQTLEMEAKQKRITEIHTEASITAKPFFERKGFTVIQKQKVIRKGIKLTNYIMTKKLS